jgi:Fe-S-cluster-containing dehydrogenase component
MKDIGRRKFIGIAAATGLAGFASGNPIARAVASRRWAMIVDLKKCREKEGCSICMAACHRTHNVPLIGNSKDEVKWVWKESFENAFVEQDHDFQADERRRSPVLVMCNHCDAPPCVAVCPTRATWKRETDGLVMMDWHRCIGCRYCMAACPYGSRSFNWRDPRPFIREITAAFPTRMRGVVEKCNFCEERITRGKMPACVEACSAGALAFGDLRDAGAPIRQVLRSSYTIRRRPGLGTQPQVYYMV